MNSSSSTGTSTGALTRRDFLRTSLGAAAAGAVAAKFAPGAFAQGREVLRVGLVGCGGRGTGAAMQTLKADPATRLVAMGDAFKDRLDGSLAGLKGSDVGDRVEVDPEHQFVGFDAYRKVIDCTDVVLLTTPPHFRPQHLAAAVAAGKHTFVEKPVAVDVPGVHKVLAASEEAKQKGLTLVSGLCWRYDKRVQEVMQRVHDGQVGEIVALQSTRHNTGVGKFREREPGMTDWEYQLRNWYYQTWLSGDFYVEQFVHDCDLMAWAMGDKYPVRCTASGGRQVRTDPGYGNIFDHFAAVYEFANGIRLFADTRQWQACDDFYLNSVMGTQGAANVLGFGISGPNQWRSSTPSDMYQLEHDAMYVSIRGGETINNGEYMCYSTLMGLMARQSAYTGKMLTWDQILNSKEDLTPPAYDWDTPLRTPPIATPGITAFV